jgi:hypothetical protein
MSKAQLLKQLIDAKMPDVINKEPSNIVNPPDQINCIKCKQDKSAAEFVKGNGRPDLSNKCQPCRDKMKKYDEKRRENMTPEKMVAILEKKKKSMLKTKIVYVKFKKSITPKTLLILYNPKENVTLNCLMKYHLTTHFVRSVM